MRIEFKARKPLVCRLVNQTPMRIINILKIIRSQSWNKPDIYADAEMNVRWEFIKMVSLVFQREY